MKTGEGMKRLGGFAAALLVSISFGLTANAQTTYTVSNTNDDGAGSLRQAIIDAEAHAGTDIIDATGVTGTITLVIGLPTITQDMTINGSGKTNLFISGNNAVRPFLIASGTVYINNLSIINGLAQGNNGGQVGAGAGMGGGIYQDAGTLYLTNVNFTGNSTIGGNTFIVSTGTPGNGNGPYDGLVGSQGSNGNNYYDAGPGGPGGFGAGGGHGGLEPYNNGGGGGTGGYGGGGGSANYGGYYYSQQKWGTRGQGGTFGGYGTQSADHCGGAGAGLGGGLFVRSTGTAVLVNCVFSNNSATGGTTTSTDASNGKGKAGALFVHPGASVTIDAVTFSGNSAADDASVDGDNNDIYGTVLSFSPKVKIGEATLLSATGATLNGSVDKNGFSTAYKFQYGTSSDFTGAMETGSSNAPAVAPSTVNDGNALALNTTGSGQYVSISDNSSMDFDSKFTIEAWVYQTDNSNNTIIDKGAYQYLFQINNGVLGFYSAIGTGAWAYSTGAIVPLNKWTHVAVTFDAYANSIKFYVNGVYQNTVNGLYLISTDDGLINIGRQGPTNCGCNTFNGNIDELKVWSTVRTPEQISANYNSILNGNETGLVAYYHFDETSGSTVADATANGNNGTIQGGGSFVDSDWFPSTTYANVSKIISGLTPGTKYYFRLSATSTKGTTLSSASSFIYAPKIQDLALWLVADSGVTVDGSNAVSQWNDLSGNGLDATQVSEGHEPTLVTGALNGHSVVRFNGSSSYLWTESVDLGSAVTIVAVAKTTGNTGNWQRIVSDNGYFLFGYNSAEAYNYYGNGAWVGAGSHKAANIGSYEILTTSITNTTDNSYLNGVASSAVGITRAAHNAPLIIGAAWENSAYAQFLNGDIAELIIYNKILSVNERKAVEAKLMTKYHVGAQSTASNPSVPSGGTGNYVLGNTGATVNFTTGSETSGTLNATVSDNPGTAGELPITVSGVNSQKYWSIQNSGLTGLTYSITLDLSDVTGITDFRSLRILKRENADSVWKDVELEPFNATVTYDEPFVTVSGLKSFSEFGLGEFSGVLPVELSSFTASVSNNRVSLNWATTTETNNYGFEIQKSVVSSQNSGWEKVGFVAGKGTTTEKQTYSFTVSSLPSSVSNLQFRLKQIDTDGRFEYSKILTVSTKADKLELSQNFPNPFNPTTKIEFTVPSSGNVKIAIYDMLGREIQSVLNKEMESGSYSVVLDGRNLASGIYFYKLAFNGQVVTKKLTLLK